MSEPARYVLMTAARNEEGYIGRTLESVAGQSILPVRWVVVDDGSSDRTAEIVEAFGKKHPYVTLQRRQPAAERTFAAKAGALRQAYASLAGLGYDFVGSLDADVTFGGRYYETMLERFRNSPRLGLAGGLIWDETGGKLVMHTISLNSVAGAVQMFRRQCYEEIGGYFPARAGGIDTIAEVSARMHGWEVRTFPEVQVVHHRVMGTASRGVLAAAWRAGIKDYRLGYHPLFYLAMCLYRVVDRPWVIGSALRLCAYAWMSLRAAPRDAPQAVVSYMQAEQMARLRAQFFSGGLRGRETSRGYRKACPGDSGDGRHGR